MNSKALLRKSGGVRLFSKRLKLKKESSYDLIYKTVFYCRRTSFILFSSSYTKGKFDGEIPRWNFIDFGQACMMIFRILCGEWIEPLYDSMRATSPASFLFFLTALVIGNFLVSQRGKLS